MGWKRGAEALNTTLKAVLANQAIHTLARRGELCLISKALELGADPNGQDIWGIRPITYAAQQWGVDHESVATLLQNGADKRAVAHAAIVCDMFDEKISKGQRAIECVRE